MPPTWLLLALVSAVFGFTFSAVSTYDFVAHLDRQVHGLHCSLLPGLSTADASGRSGCHVALMSPYSSMFRESIWGGIPISVPAMAVFAFIAFACGAMWLTRRETEPTATGFLLLSSVVPALASLVMAVISLSALDALCMLCLGIYLSSAACLFGSVMLFRQAVPTAPVSVSRGLSTSSLGAAFVVACVFIGVSTLAYAAAAPDFDAYVGSCGSLGDTSSLDDVLIPLGPQTSKLEVVEVLDPLCAACRGFERRYTALDTARETSRRILLFPLDHRCNWMIDGAIHPGACSVSEAIVCAADDASRVLSWAFDHQTEIIEAETEKAGAAERMLSEQFPELARCIGSSAAKVRLNQSLRWAVKQKLPVLTPQLYVGGERLCDADTDLGLDYMLGRLAEHARSKVQRVKP